VGEPFSLALELFDDFNNACSQRGVLAGMLPGLRPRIQIQPEILACHVDKMKIQVEQGKVLLKNLVITGALASGSIGCRLKVTLPQYRNCDVEPLQLPLRTGPVRSLKLLNCPETVENAARLPLLVEPIDECGNRTSFTENAELSVSFSPNFVTGTTSQRLNGDLKQASFPDLVAHVDDCSAWEKSLYEVPLKFRVRLTPENVSKADSAIEVQAGLRVLPRRAPVALGFLLEGQVHGMRKSVVAELKLPAGNVIKGWKLLAWDEAGRQISRLLEPSKVKLVKSPRTLDAPLRLSGVGQQGWCEVFVLLSFWM
jgi:hypothetical protein